MNEATGAAAEAEFHTRLRSATAHAKRILDVGAGDGRMRSFYPADAFVVAVDAHKQALSGYSECIIGLAQEELPCLNSLAFDVVLGLDFIEHLTYSDTVSVITDMKRLAAVRVCLFVPEGEHPQAGTLENPYQAHLRTWSVPMLEALEFTVVLWPEFHSVPGKARGAMWATWERK